MPMVRVLAVVAGAILVLMATTVALGIYLNDRAAMNAAALCAKVRPGMDEETALVLARSTAARHLDGANKHEFRFQGWVFNAASCEVTVVSGKVSSAVVVGYTD
jgi:hypothetical protein